MDKDLITICDYTTVLSDTKKVLKAVDNLKTKLELLDVFVRNTYIETNSRFIDSYINLEDDSEDLDVVKTIYELNPELIKWTTTYTAKNIDEKILEKAAKVYNIKFNKNEEKNKAKAKNNKSKEKKN